MKIFTKRPNLWRQSRSLLKTRFSTRNEEARHRALDTMFLAIDGSTGNIFFDLDYQTDMPPAIAVETLDYLHREWKRSQPIARQCDQAFNLITTDPQVYVKFLDAYRASLRKRKA